MADKAKSTKIQKNEKRDIPQAASNIEVLPPELNEVMSSIAPEKRDEFLRIMSITLTKWKAPLPRPQDLEHYEKIQKGLANRIVSMTENEQSYRHNFNNKGLSGEIRLRTLGLIFAFIIVIACLISTIILYSLSRDSNLTIALIVEIALIAGGFIYWSKKDNPSKQNNK